MGFLYGILPIYRFPADFHVTPCRQQSPNAPANHFVIVRDQNSHSVFLFGSMCKMIPSSNNSSEPLIYTGALADKARKDDRGEGYLFAGSTLAKVSPGNKYSESCTVLYSSKSWCNSCAKRLTYQYPRVAFTTYPERF